MGLYVKVVSLKISAYCRHLKLLKIAFMRYYVTFTRKNNQLNILLEIKACVFDKIKIIKKSACF